MNKYSLIDCEGKDILDIGCNSGIASRILRGYRTYTGIDNDEKAITIAKKRNRKKNVFFILCDYLDVYGSYDIILMMDFLEHVPKQKDIIDKAFDMLRKDGSLFLTTPNKDAVVSMVGRTEKYHPFELSYFELHSLLRRFCLKKIMSFDPDFSKSFMLKMEFITAVRKHIPFVFYEKAGLSEPNIEIHNFNTGSVGLFIEGVKR